MSKKILLSCFLLALSIFLVATVALGVFAYFIYAGQYGEETAARMLVALSAPFLVVFTAVLLLSLLLSVHIASGIMRPIRELDLVHPNRKAVYPELAPILGYIEDSNRQARVQMNELMRRRTEFDTLTAHMSEGMIILNDRAEILSCNRAARTLFSLAEDGVPKNVLTLRATEGFRAAVRSALAGQNGYDLWQSGETYYSLLATPVLHEGGVEGAVLMFLDVTEKEERERLRREFTANISHELKTPLTSISGFAELIANGIADGEDSRRFAGNIHREASRLITLVADIIRLSQLDGGEFKFEEEPLDLSAIAHEVVERLENVAATGEITLTAEGETAYIAGNLQIVSQMVYSLAENGIRYNRRGGFVRVSVGKSEDSVLLTVSDNGIGIPTEAQPRVFERFFRVDKSHSKEIGGTGLGLSIVKHGALCHGATVSLASEEGKGTEITVRFPKSAT